MADMEKIEQKTTEQPVSEQASSHEPPKETIEDETEAIPTLHAKTWFAVFAVCFIYFAQLINVVGAGAVRFGNSALLRAQTGKQPREPHADSSKHSLPRASLPSSAAPQRASG